MDYAKFNQLFKEGFNTFRYKNERKRVGIDVVHQVDEEGEQGESNEIYEIYDMGLGDGMFIKLQISYDSYGENEFVDGVQFVKAREKTVTVYE